jgi:hypothetical protein
MFQELGGNPLTGGTWRNPSNQITDAIFNPANELGGNYTYYYPNVNCTPTVSTISVTIQANPSAGNDANVEICQSLSLFDLNSTVSANATPGGTWRNSLGATVSNAVSIPAIGNYQFSYNVGGGDCASDQAIINISVVGFNPNIPATSVSLCSTDASFDLSSLYAAYPTVVFQSASGASISNLLNPATAVSGVLTAVYPSTNVCPNRTANVTVTINTPAFSSRTVSYALCETTSSLDLSTLATGINFSNGTWTTSTGVATNASQTGLVPGNYGFLFTSFPNGTCGSSVLTVNVTMDASVSAGGDGSVAYCSTAPFQSFANLMPATVNQGGSWYYLNTPYNELGIDPASSPSGIYRYIIPPNGTCPGDDCSLTVDIDAFVEANAGNDISQCANNATVAIGTVGSPGATYSWSPAAPLSNANVPQPTLTLSNNGSVPLTTTFTLNVTNGLCSDTDQVEVSINPLAQASVTPMVETCAGESVTSTASGGSTYSWQPAGLFANPLSNEVSYIPTASATLIVTVSNAWNCSDTDTTLVVVHPTPSAVLNIEDVQGCSPVSTTIHVEPGGDYSELKWFLSGEWMADGDTLSVTLEESGEYDIAIALVSDFGCVDTIFSDATIQVYPNPKANFSITPSHLSVLNDVAVMQNQSEEATEYRWDFAGIGSSDLANPSFTFPSEIARTFEVCLYVNTDFGCADSVCNMIEMLHEVAFYAPNAITADNDGVNDVFLPVMLGFETDTYNMKIFNRWGDLIFETTDPTEPWVADVRSGEYYAHGDVYQWIVTVKENGIAEYQTFKGFVTVLR